MKTGVFCAATLAATFSFGSASASTTGIPILNLGSTDVSILNFFQGGLPSDVLEFRVTGNVTSQIGAPNFQGAPVVAEFGTVDLLSAPFGTFATLDLDGVEIASNWSGVSYAPGLIEISYLIDSLPTTPLGGDVFALDPPYDIFGNLDFSAGVTDNFPELVMSIAYSGDLPMKTFDGTTAMIPDFPYIEGQLTADVSFALKGGADPSVVPLPASLPLVMLGLGGLAMAGRRRRR
jgi:hypothetical protein